MPLWQVNDVLDGHGASGVDELSFEDREALSTLDVLGEAKLLRCGGSGNLVTVECTWDGYALLIWTGRRLGRVAGHEPVW